MTARKTSLSVLTICIVLSAWLWIATRQSHYDAEDHSPLENLAHFNATDACEMFQQFGSRFDKDGRRVRPVVTVYLRAPQGRRPETGDLIEIMYPKELQGRVKFIQTKSNGYGGSGPLEWIGTNRPIDLGMAVFDSTYSGSLQYQKDNILLWGDCKKAETFKR